MSEILSKSPTIWDRRLIVTQSMYMRNNQPVTPRFNKIQQGLQEFCKQQEWHFVPGTLEEVPIPILPGDDNPSTFVKITLGEKGDFWLTAEISHYLCLPSNVSFEDAFHIVEKAFPDTFVQISAKYRYFLDREPI